MRTCIYCGEKVQENTPMEPKLDPLTQLPYFCPNEKRLLTECETVLDNFTIGTYFANQSALLP